jgi:predicted RNase H-like HicB family nuclease
LPRYLVIYESGPGDGGKTTYSAFSPDLPGCVAAGDTKDEVRELMTEAIAFHLDGLREDGDPIPEGSSEAELVVIPS